MEIKITDINRWKIDNKIRFTQFVYNKLTGFENKPTEWPQNASRFVYMKIEFLG